MQVPWELIVADSLSVPEKDGHEFGAVHVISALERAYHCVHCGGVILFYTRVDAVGQTFGFIPDDVLFDPCKKHFTAATAA